MTPIRRLLASCAILALLMTPFGALAGEIRVDSLTYRGTDGKTYITQCSTYVGKSGSSSSCFTREGMSGEQYRIGSATDYLKRNLKGVNKDGSKVSPGVQALRLTIGTIITSPFLLIDALLSPLKKKDE